jgi:TonB family protein
MDLSRSLGIALVFLSLTVGSVADDQVLPIQDLQEKGTLPKPLKQEPPTYPRNMRLAGLAGKVLVEFVIDTQGLVQNPVVVRSNNPWFERPAIEAILKWRFKPAEMEGTPVKVRALQLLEFDPEQSGSKDGLWYVPRQKFPKEYPEELRWEIAPQPVKTAFPIYPLTALQSGQAGWSEIKFIIGPAGRITASQLLGASHSEMGQAALAMIDTWEFTPPKKKDGTPCYAALTIKHEFKPHSGDVPVSDEARKVLGKLEKNPAEIVSFKELDRPCQPLSRRPPVYPTRLLKAGQPGDALIEFFIAPNGDAELPSIISSSAPEFGYAAMQAVATWRFEPPLKGGKPTTVRVRIPIEFDARTPAGASARVEPESTKPR